MAAYYALMVESATILGADRREAEQQLLDVLQFETVLANVSIAALFLRADHRISTLSQSASSKSGNNN